MRKALLSLSLFALTTITFGQARLVFNNATADVYMVFDTIGAPSIATPTYLVIDNPAVNAITMIPAAGLTAADDGSIVSEEEFNFIRWKGAATAAATYVIPYRAAGAAGAKIPLRYQVTAGAAIGGPDASVIFSTYRYGIYSSAPSWRNFLYRPSDVTHMNNFTTGTTLTPGATDESGHVVDRFWIMDTKVATFNYTTNPAVTLAFVYPQAEVTAGNTILGTSPVFPQRFNSTTNRWGDYLPSLGTFALNQSLTNPVVGVNRVQNYAIPVAQYFRSWTLADISDPLPIELTDLRAECETNQVVVTWTTATETNNAYYTVQRSLNGLDWSDLGTVNGSGTTVESHIYTFVDNAPAGLAYYRLIQTDNDGDWSSSNMVAGGCGTGDGLDIVSVYDANGDVNIIVSSTFETIFDVSLIDASGKVLGTKAAQTINQGITPLRMPKGTIATGVYVVRLSNSQQVLTGRVMLN